MEAIVFGVEIFGTMFLWFAIVSSWLDKRARQRGEVEAGIGISQIAVYGWILPLALLWWPMGQVNNWLFGY